MASPDLDPLRPLHGRARRADATDDLQAAAHRLSTGDFLVCNEGPVRGPFEPALSALREAGCAAILARSLADAFVHAAIHVALPALIVEEAPAIRDGDRLRVDIEGHKVANLDSGDRYVIRNIYDADLDVLRAGGLVAFRSVMDEIKRRHGM